jgi:hypothetical protein
LHRQGFSAAQGLATWQGTALSAGAATLEVTALPGRHATGPARLLLPPVMGSMLEFRPAPAAEPLRVYLTGDTLVVEDLREIPRRYPVIDTAVMHLGGTTLPGGLVVTMDAAQGADLLELLAPTRAVPVHYDDYSVFRSPLEAFLAETEQRGLRARVSVVARGDTLDLRA